jgi:Zn-dependent M28 family amino/carboxypeptidase
MKLKSPTRKHTFVFVAFAEEENGLVGSSRFVKELAKERRARVRAFVNLECLGLGPTNVWVHRATPALVSRLGEVARAMMSG